MRTIYRIQVKRFGAVCWRMFDKTEYPERSVAKEVVDKLNEDDCLLYMVVRIDKYDD